MQINPPYAYKDILPLDKVHRVLVPKERDVPTVFRTLNAVPLSFTEFPRASRDYPVVFISGDAGKSFVAMIALGLERAQNLFLLADGSWDRRVYYPAYVRRYPFCMAKITLNGVEREERIVCVEKESLDAKGMILFDSTGNSAPDWAERHKLLVEYEADQARTLEMCAILKDFGLLEPFSMQAALQGEAAVQLTGMHRVLESRLEQLGKDDMRTLLRKNILEKIYAHHMSLENFTRLLARKLRLSGSKLS